MKTAVFSDYINTVKKIAARPDPFAERLAVPEENNNKPAPYKRRKYEILIASAAVVICIAVGVTFHLSAISRDTDADDISAPVTQNDTEGFEEICAMLDMEIPEPSELIERADIIMIGEYIDEFTPSELAYKGNPNSGTTRSRIKALKIFKGSELINDGEVTVMHEYIYWHMENEKDRLVLDTYLVPMYKGDRAIFLLFYNENNKCFDTGDLFGRYPLPENKDKPDRLGFVNGLRSDVSNGRESVVKHAWERIYEYILKNYDLTLDE